MATNKNLNTKEQKELLEILKRRFGENMIRHKGLQWKEIQERLVNHPGKLWSLSEMERTGGEPDVIGYDEKARAFLFCDCSRESPEGRRNTCYDRKGQESREKQGIHPSGNVTDMAGKMGIEVIDEEQYRRLQKHGPFDTKTSSWIRTPEDILKAGGALFGDHRYGHVFIYHNSARSFYSARGFRGLLIV